MLEEQDAKTIADLMMVWRWERTLCADGIGRAAYEVPYPSHEPDDGSIPLLHSSIMLESKTDISTPEARFMDGGHGILGYTFPE